jgi:hypothetical protein
MLRVWGRVERVPDKCELPGTVGALRQSALTPHCKPCDFSHRSARAAARRGAGNDVAHLARNLKFESGSLHRRVNCELHHPLAATRPCFSAGTGEERLDVVDPLWWRQRWDSGARAR